MVVNGSDAESGFGIEGSWIIIILQYQLMVTTMIKRAIATILLVTSNGGSRYNTDK